MGKVWYDLSDLYDWEGSFTGIQRVVYNLAKKIDTRNETHFFIYRGGKFSEVTLEQLDERLAQLNRKSVETKKLVRRRVGLSIGKIHHNNMVLLKDMVRGTNIETRARRIYGAARSIYRKSRNKPSLIDHSYNMFSSGDVVLIMGGNWHLEGYIETLIKARNERKFRLVHSVNDIIALVNPAFVNEGGEQIIGRYFKQVIAKSDTLIAISEATKKDIEWYFETVLNGQPSDLDIHVIELGDEIPASINQRQPDTDISKEFILAVGTIEIRKNYRLLYDTYKLASRKDMEMPQLVIVGRKGWMADETYALLTRDVELRGKVIILEGVDDAELRWLYENCTFTVFPSMYEGWGLPIAESLRYGKCCVASNASSMPEVGGELAVYASPYDTSELLMRIQELSNLEYRSKQEQKIKSFYKPRTWDQTYAQLDKIIGK